MLVLSVIRGVSSGRIATLPCKLGIPDNQFPAQSIMALKKPIADNVVVGNGNDCPDESENQKGKEAHSQHNGTSSGPGEMVFVKNEVQNWVK